MSVARALVLGAVLAGSSVLAAAAPRAAAGDEVPRAVLVHAVERFTAGVARDAEAIRTDPERARRLAEATVFPLLDLARTARIVAGVRWRSASAAERRAFVAAFEAWARRTVVAAIRTYSGAIARHADRIAFPAAPAPVGDRATVPMRVHLETGPTLDVRFRMRRAGGAWRVDDAAVEGVSIVLLQRREIAAEAHRVGLGGVIARMAARGAAGASR